MTRLSTDGGRNWDELDPTSPAPVKLADLIEPMPGRIAVQVETKAEITPGGLYIPVQTARSIHEQRATQGTIIAIGTDDDDDFESAPSRVKLGDVVLFGKYTGTEISWRPPGDRNAEQQKVVIMLEKDVLAILRSPEQAANIKVKA